jgi:hypothetical protein
MVRDSLLIYVVQERGKLNTKKLFSASMPNFVFQKYENQGCSRKKGV